jgi:predicted ATP-dependent serine protease
MTDAPLFYTSKTIASKPKKELIRIPTGFSELDRKMALNKGEVSVFSGNNGSAKSTVLSQLALNVVNNGNKVALFSGELKEDRVLNWLQLQAAGRHYTHSGEYENYYSVDDGTKQKINEWLEQKLFIYNNDYGKKSCDILKSVEYCIQQKRVDLVILDNLMSIDLDSTSFNKNEKQSSFVQSIVDFAKKHDVHIVLVAHPRKSIGFLRKDDISGTADLTNAVDNVFIIHRVNSDFKRLTKLTLNWKTDDDMYDYDNVIEICKNRDLGHQDVMIGLYFEIESKRMSCYKENNRIYGWLKHSEDNIEIDEEIKAPFDL